MTTLSDWEDSTTILLCRKLPLQTYDSAMTLVQDYVTSVGGWVPVDSTVPTGDGALANGQSQDQASTSITNLQYARIYSCDLTVHATLGLNLNVNLVSGLDTPGVIESLVATLNAWVTSQLEGTKITLETIDSYTANITNRGILLTADQTAINNLISGEGKLLDPRAIALNLARQVFTLDSTWNISHVYTEDTENFACIVEKYQSSSYLVRDTSATNYYVISLDGTSYALISGSKLSY
jgi:hypothetical protein